MTCFSRCLASLGVLSLLIASGCATSLGARNYPLVWGNPHAASETLSQTPEEHYQRIARIRAHDARALSEDLDILFMTDRTSRLTRWHDR